MGGQEKEEGLYKLEILEQRCQNKTQKVLPINFFC